MPNPTTADLAAGAAAAAGLLGAAPVVVAVGGGSPIDAAKGIALAAVNPQRGRDLDYRSDFARPALPLLAVPTTAGTGAETNAFGVVTDERQHRKFYVGHASTMPAAAILDPDLTIGLPPGADRGDRDGRADPRAGVVFVVAGQPVVGGHRAASRPDGQRVPAARCRGRRAMPRPRGQMLLAAHMAGDRDGVDRASGPATRSGTRSAGGSTCRTASR